MAGIEQVKELALADICDRVFLRVAVVEASFSELANRLAIVPEQCRDELDAYEYATLKYGSLLFQLEKYKRERGYALLLLSNDPNVRETARAILSALGVSQDLYRFTDEGYGDYGAQRS